jgi:hypothetical protein
MRILSKHYEKKTGNAYTEQTPYDRDPGIVFVQHNKTGTQGMCILEHHRTGTCDMCIL